jgi:hypothetical protein
MARQFYLLGNYMHYTVPNTSQQECDGKVRIWRNDVPWTTCCSRLCNSANIDYRRASNRVMRGTYTG